MTNELDLAPIEARAEKVCQRTTSENYGTEEWLAFCAHAKRDIPALITEVERLRALLEKREGEPYEAMRVRLAAALKENEELRADAELGRLVREALPEMARMAGESSLICFEPFGQTCGQGRRDDLAERRGHVQLVDQQRGERQRR